jgi:hypothetical protein
MGPSKSVEKPALFVSAKRNALIGKARNPVLISDSALSGAVLGPAAAGAFSAMSALTALSGRSRRWTGSGKGSAGWFVLVQNREIADAEICYVELIDLELV